MKIEEARAPAQTPEFIALEPPGALTDGLGRMFVTSPEVGFC